MPLPERALRCALPSLLRGSTPQTPRLEPRVRPAARLWLRRKPSGWRDRLVLVPAPLDPRLYPPENTLFPDATLVGGGYQGGPQLKALSSPEGRDRCGEEWSD